MKLPCQANERRTVQDARAYLLAGEAARLALAPAIFAGRGHAGYARLASGGVVESKTDAAKAPANRHFISIKTAN